MASTGAEAVLKQRALRSNGDFDWGRVHLEREQQRVHHGRHAGGAIPFAA